MTEITAEVIASHGLSQEEFQRIQKILGRDPMITEVGMFSVLWSEHCSYKNSKVQLKKFPTKGQRVLLGPGENSGVIDIGNGVGLSFKVESHNHPSAIEPYQGAATGIGGIIRDIFSMGARPIAGLDSLRFGSIREDRQSRHLFEYVVKGIGDYGNCVGIPTVAGDVYFEDSYRENCLVNAMCVGVVQAGEKIISPLYGPMIQGVARGEGNPVLYVGASTGRDGIHGATFASVELTEESTESKSSVQVGDPFQEKLLIEACLELLKTDCVVGLGDMGAAGLTSSLSEMASRGGHGVEIDISKVPQREKGMTPYEIMLSESQERMVIVLEKGKEQKAFDIFEKWGLHAIVIGHVTTDGMFRVMEGTTMVAEMPADSLAADAPVYTRKGVIPVGQKDLQRLNLEKIKDVVPAAIEKTLLQLLATPNIASKKWVYEQYDHMVQTNSLVYPGRADAAVLNIKDTDKRIAVKTDGNGRYCYLNPEMGGRIAVAESARNVACTGAQPVALTNCLNFGNPEKPTSFWFFEKAIDGMVAMAEALGTPVISGNVSLYNESEKGAIYPTPVVGMVGLFSEGVSPMTMSFKDPEDLIYMLGATGSGLGGSEYLKEVHGMVQGDVFLDVDIEKTLQLSIVGLIEKGLIKSAHDVSDGGLLVNIAESMLEYKLGAEICIDSNNDRVDNQLFGESQSRIVVSVSADKKNKFEKYLLGFPKTLLGKVTADYRLSVGVAETTVEIKGSDIEEAYHNSINKIMEST